MKTLKDGIRRRRTFGRSRRATQKSETSQLFRFRRTSNFLRAAESIDRARRARALPPPLYVLFSTRGGEERRSRRISTCPLRGPSRTPRRSAKRGGGARVRGEGSKSVRTATAKASRRRRRRLRVQVGGWRRRGRRAHAQTRANIHGRGRGWRQSLRDASSFRGVRPASGSVLTYFRASRRKNRVVSCETRASLDADLLVNLFPDDDGEESPNAANALRWRGFRWDADGRSPRATVSMMPSSACR